MSTNASFDGAALRLARLFGGLTLEDVALAIGKSRQYLHKLETAQSQPTPQLAAELAATLRVELDFFSHTRAGVLAEEQVHFRKLGSTRIGVKQVAIARAEMTGLLVACLERRVKLPAVRLPAVSDTQTIEDVERAAEFCRREWDLGLGPIADMTRLAEHVGAVVTSFPSVSTEIDAMSFAMGRPIIVRNEAKRSTARQRFDIGHELAHAILHSGRPTGDQATESEAHRFSGALLAPRSMMLKLFPRPKGYRLDWIGLSEFKKTWGISKAALLYRARQLELLTDQQYRSGAITLRRTGEANGEREDQFMPLETPSLLRGAFDLLAKRKNLFAHDIAQEMRVSVEFLEDLVGFQLPKAAPTRPILRLVA